MFKKVIILALFSSISTRAQNEAWRGRPPKKNYEKESKSSTSSSSSTASSKVKTSTASTNANNMNKKPKSTSKSAATSTPTGIAGTGKGAVASPSKTSKGSNSTISETAYETMRKSKQSKTTRVGAGSSKSLSGSRESQTYHKETPNSQYKLMYMKGSCPTKTCSGSSVSDVGAIAGIFNTISDIDALILHPEWSLAEIRGVQAGIWPANDNIGACFNIACPTQTTINEAVSNAEGDALALAQANPTMDLARLQKALGGKGGSSKANSKTTAKPTDSKGGSVKTRPKLNSISNGEF